MRVIPLVILLVLTLIPFISAEKTVKTIEIPIGYHATTNPYEVYQDNFSVYFPDGINEIISMEYITKGDYNSLSGIFGGIIAGESIIYCNPMFWITPNQSVYNYEINYDCSDVVKQSGWKGSITPLTFAFFNDKAASNIKPRIKITYYNNPKGSLEISGTEYSPNDPATIFVQLRDNEGLAISNGSCYLDIYSPLINGTHNYSIQDAPMLFAGFDDGLYYYDLTAPSTLGVYMLSAKCSYNFNWVWFYPPEEMIYYPVQQINSGTWQGTSQVLNSRSDDLYQRCDGSIAQPCSSNYTFNLSVYGTISNITNVNVYFAGEDDVGGRILTISYWNGTAFVDLANTLTFSGTSTTVPTGYDEFLTNSVPLNAIINNTIKLRLVTAGSTRVFYNWLSLALLSSSGTIQDIKGSSEMHITDIANSTASIIQNLTLNVNSSLIAETIWNYASRNLTYFDFITQALTVWNSSSRNLTYFDYLTQADTVWNFTSRNLTYFDFVTQALIVWNNTNRNLTYFDFATQARTVWNNTDRNLTYYPDMTNYLLEAQMIWNFTSRNLTYFDFVTAAINTWNSTSRNLTYYQDFTNYSLAADIFWNFPARNLTYYQDIFNYTLAAQTVWNFGVRNLTYYQDVFNYTLMPQLIWNYIDRNLTYIPDMTNYFIIQEMVWNASNRNLTYYDTNFSVTATINNTAIAEVVWNFENRNLTYYNLGNNLSTNDIWNFVSRNLTWYQDVMNYSLASQTTWEYNNRSLTYYLINNISVVDIWGYLNRSLTEDISQKVWLYQDRNLTLYPDMTNYTFATEIIWSYANRSLTQDIPFEIWTFASRNLTQNISLDVWTYYNKSLNFYPDVTNYSLIWEYPSRNLSYYGDATNYTNVALNVWNYSGTINSNILTQIALAIWNYAGSITTITNQVSQSVWAYTARYTHGEILD